MNALALALSAALLGASPTASPAPAAGGLTWQVPAAWSAEGPRPMRAATYKLPAAKGDAQGAELAVFHFGAGQGGDVELNVKRWLSQFTRADGSPADADARRSTESRGGLRLTTLDVAGTYNPGMMMGPSTPRPGWRLLGAIVEGGSEGPVFFKLTGPARTVAAAQKDFQKLLKSVKRGG
jgi:hypothetical protein